MENNDSNTLKPPTVLDGFLQPGFPAKVFTCFFVEDHLVFAKTGSFSTNSAGTMQGALGGFTGAAMVAGAIGSLMDMHNDSARAENAANLAAYSPDKIVAAHKNNFKLPFSNVKSVEIKGPNFAGEVKVIVDAGNTHKFRIDRQSKATTAYIVSVFDQFLPGKVIKK